MHYKTHAPSGGIVGENDRFYAGGEFVPFYKPRPVMPQVDDKAYPALVEFMEANGVPFAFQVVPWQRLHAHQHIDRVKAEHIPQSVLAIPLLVSGDYFILDGNHRWLAHKLADKRCVVLRIHLPFDDAIGALDAFLEQDPAGQLKRELTTA